MRRAQDTIHGAAPGYRRLSNTHSHGRSAVHVVKGFTHMSHRGVTRILSSCSTLTYMRTVSCHQSPGPILSSSATASRGGSSTRRGTYQIMHRHILRNSQISADQYRTTAYHKEPPYSGRDTIGPEQFITTCPMEWQIPNSIITHCQGKGQAQIPSLRHRQGKTAVPNSINNCQGKTAV